MARKKLLEKIRHQLTFDIETKKISMNSAKIVTDLVSSTHSFSSFDSKFSSLSKDFSPKQKGDAFEWFAKLYFLSYAKMYDVKRYFTRLDGQIPSRLNISLKDVGSDAVLEHSSGEISLIQIKYRRPGYGLKRESVVNMAGESKLHPKANVRSLILFSNVLQPPKLDEEERASLVFILKPELIESKWELLQLCASYGISSKIPRNLTLDLPPLREWQTEALEWVLSRPKIGRMQLAVACGAGKSRLAREVITQGRYGQVLILVPNLQLLSQWFEMLSVSNPERDYLLVGSDLDVDEGDERIKPRYHLTTSVDEIARFYVSSQNSIVISTYQSCDRIIESRIDFDLCIADEGHRCCSLDPNSNFAIPTRQDFPSSQMIFMTATPKIFKRSGEEDVKRGMDNEEIFGPRYTYSFKRAIDAGVISDYQILVGCAHVVDGDTKVETEESDEELSINSSNETDDSRIEKFEARFLLKSVLKYDLKNCLIFSNSHAKSKKLYDETVELAQQEGVEVECLLMRPNSRSSDKLEARQRIERGDRLLIFNVRVFDVGSDLPRLESVMLSQGRKSITQTVQSVSRCLRKREGKVAKILVPCLVRDEDDLESDGGFKGLRSFLAALGSVDEAITEEIAGKEGVKKRIFFDLVSDKGGFERKDGVEELESIREFEVKAMERLGDSGMAGTMKRFEALKRFCIENDRLPKRKEEYEGVKVGIFLKSLIEGKQLSQYRDVWLKDLKDVSENLKVQLNSRLSNQGKYNDQLPPEKKYELLKEFVTRFDRLPKSSEEYNGAKIGCFLSHLITGGSSKTSKKRWIDDLCSISENLKAQIDFRLSRQGTLKNQLASEEKYELLKQFCLKYQRLPKNKELYNGVALGSFFSNLITGNQYKRVRELWINQLLLVSKEVKNQLEKRLANKGKNKALRPPEEKFRILKEFCFIHQRLPKASEDFKAVHVGSFLTYILSVLNNPTYKEWLNQLFLVSKEIKLQLEKRLANRGKNKDLRPIEEKFEILKEFCENFDRLPKQKETYKDTGIGNLCSSIIDGRQLKSCREKWIEIIKRVSPNIRAQIEKRLTNQGKNKGQLSSTEKFRILEEFCQKTNRLPVRSEEYLNVKIGGFLGSLFCKNGSKHKNEMILKLKQISKVLDSEITQRLENREKPKDLSSPELKFKQLAEFCKLYNRLPKTTETYHGTNVGTFMQNLLAKGERLKEFRETWITSLMSISEDVKLQIIEKMNNLGKKISQTPTEKFDTLKEFCRNFDRLPKSSEVYLEINVGVFFRNVLQKCVKNGSLDERILALKLLSDKVSQEIDEVTKNIGKYKGQLNHREKFELLRRYCVDYGELPKNKTEYQETKLGVFSSNLLSGKVFKEDRKQWLDQLCSISPEISEQIRSRANNYP